MLKNTFLGAIFSIIVCTLFVKNATAQDFGTKQSPRQYVYRSWNNQNGLPQNTVNDLVKDRDGYLWIATEEGLIRFDGSNFTIYDESNTPGLHSSVFYDITPSATGIWASSRNTVLWLEKQSIHAYDFRKHLNNGWIKSVEADSNGRVWVGTSSGNLFYIEHDSIMPYNNWKSSLAGSIDVLLALPGGLLIGTSNGLWEIRKAQEKLEPIPLLDSTAITALAFGKDFGIWVGTAEDGLYYLGKDTIQITEKQGLNEPFVSSLAIGSEGEVWIGTRSSGFQIYDDGGFIDLGQKVYSHDGIKSLLLSEEEVVWIGTTSSGLVQMKPAQIQMLKTDKKLAESIILPIYEHSNGDIWIGTAGKGINRLRGDRITNLTTLEGLSNNLVLSVYGTEDYIYIGTANGLDRFNMSNEKIDRHYSKKDGLTTNSIQCIFYDSRGQLWINSRSGGIHRMKNADKIEKVLLPKELENVSFLTMMEDRNGNIWFGSRGAGMLKIDRENQITHFNQEKKFSAEVVYCFFEDKQGSLWMGTEKGLACYSKGEFNFYSKKAGLHFNEIYRVMQDDKGFVWLSGNHGLQRLDLTALLHSNDTAKVSVKLFNTVDGMANAETNGGFFPAGWKMKNGQLWFPTVQGIAIVNPSFINEEPSPLNIHLQSIHYGNKEFDFTGEIEIPPNIYNLEIEYTSIDFSKAKDIKYHYRLKGFSDDWINAGNRNRAYYSALGSGTYHFEVKAERYGRWSPVASSTFTILPHFYQTWWFRFLLVFIFLAIVTGLILLQKKKNLRKLRDQKNITRAQLSGQEKERQIIGAELHDNINQQLATAKLYLDFAKSNEKERLSMIDNSEKVVLNVINEIRSLCKSLTPPTLKDIGLKDAVDELLQAYTAVGKFQIHFDCTAPLEQLEEDISFSLFRIMQEQMNNIGKHAEACEVWVKFYKSGTNIHLTIKDDGKGHDLKTSSSGRGLTNIKNRLELFNGQMEVHSSPGNGFTLSVIVPS